MENHHAVYLFYCRYESNPSAQCVHWAPSLTPGRLDAAVGSGIAKAFWNRRLSRWYSEYNKARLPLYKGALGLVFTICRRSRRGCRRCVLRRRNWVLVSVSGAHGNTGKYPGCWLNGSCRNGHNRKLRSAPVRFSFSPP